MEIKMFNLYSAMHIFGNMQFIVSGTMQRIKKLKIQTDGICSEKISVCNEGRQQTEYGENAIRYMPVGGFRTDYRGKT